MNKIAALSSLRNMALCFIIGISTQQVSAQHCNEKSVADNGAAMKIRAGGGFAGSYALPCIAQGVFTEINIPFQVFNTIPRGNGDDTVYQMKIDQIANLPAGMCWVTSKADNIFKKGEGGLLVFRGVTNDNSGQYNIALTLSFDTNGAGDFNRANVNYNKVSKTGRMILRVNNAEATCEPVDYDNPGNISGGVSTVFKQ